MTRGIQTTRRRIEAIKLFITGVLALSTCAITPVQAQEPDDSLDISIEEVLSMPYDSLLEMSFEKISELARLSGISVDELFNMRVSTAGKKKEKIADIPASVVVVTREEIEKLGYQNLVELLENVPGLYPINPLFFSGTSFGVRGSWADQDNSNIIIMVDGIKQTFEYTGANPLTKIPVPIEAIERIEIIRGPMSVMYGSGAFFGAINIITSCREKTTNKIHVSASAGSLETGKAYLGIRRYVGNNGLEIYTGWQQSGGMNIPFSDLTTRDSAYQKIYNLSSTKNRLESNSKYFSILGKQGEFTGQLIYIESMQEGNLFSPSGGEGSQSTKRSTLFSLQYNKRFSQNFTIDAKLRYQRDWDHVDFSRSMRMWYDSTLVTMKGMFEFDQSESNALETEFNAFYNPLYNLSFTAGISYRGITELSYKNDHPVYRLPIYYRAVWYIDNPGGITNLAPYFQIDYSPLANLRFVGGFRVQFTPDYSYTIRYAFDSLAFSPGYFTNQNIHYHYKPQKYSFIPRFAIIYSLNDNNVLKFLYGKAFKNPNFESVTDATTRGFSVNPEYINTWELNYSSRIIKELGLSSSIYLNYLDDLILRRNLYDSVEHVYYSVLDNSGARNTFGGEINLKYSPSRKFSAELSYNYQKTENRHKNTDTLPVPYSPDHLACLKVHFSPWQNITLSGTATFVDAMHSDYNPLKVNKDQTLGGFYGRGSDAYINFGTNLRWEKIAGTNLYTSLRISNLLDSKQYYPSTNFSSWADLGTLRPGRTFLFSLGYIFK